MVEITYKEFGRDYRTAMKKVVEAQSAAVRKQCWITTEFEEYTYYVFRLQVFQPDNPRHQKLKFIDVTSRDMKDQTVFYMNLARDLMLNLRITARASRPYLMMARPGAQVLIADRIGVDEDELKDIILESGVGSGVWNQASDEARTTYRSKIKASEKEMAATEAKRVKAEEKFREASNERFKANGLHGESENIRRSLEHRIRDLETALRDSGISPPPYSNPV